MKFYFERVFLWVEVFFRIFRIPKTHLLSQEEKVKKFKSWLDNLQQESWQLELLISGFAIFAVFSAIEPFNIFMSSISARNEGQEYIILMAFIGVGVYLALAVLAFNLSVHIIMRGLWIGAIGLRYFSGDIDFERLHYTSKFDSYLKNKIGSFDAYIAKLEDYCSLIFSITFLIIFFCFSLIIQILVLICIGLIGKNLGSDFTDVVLISIFIIFVLCSLLTAIDFFSQGILKKYKWTSFFYFPIYRVYSKISLSFIYRPMLYNFLDNKKGKWILGLLIPFYFIVALISTLSIEHSNYHSYIYHSSENYLLKNNYYEEIKDIEVEFVRSVSLPSKIIKDNPLPVFIVHTSKMEDVVYKLNPGIKPKKDLRGLRVADGISFGGDARYNAKVEEDFELYLQKISNVISIKIDGRVYPSEFVATVNNKEQLGLETFLDIEGLQKGKHLLQVESKKIVKDSIINYELAKIPFWYYP